MRIIIFLSFVLLLSSCISNKEHRGYVTEYANFDAIQPGITTANEVLNILGSPSTTSGFGEEIWYYVGMEVASKAILNPKIKKQNVVAISFDKSGLVTNIDKSNGNQRRDIDIAKDSTSTEGNNITIIEQFLGNLGRFNPDNK